MHHYRFRQSRSRNIAPPLCCRPNKLATVDHTPDAHRVADPEPGDCAADGGDMINDLMPGNAGIARAAHSDRSWRGINDADAKFGCMPLRSGRTPLFLPHVASPVTRSLSRRQGYLYRHRQSARHRRWRGGDPHDAQNPADATGCLPHAGCAGRRAICGQGAGAAQPGHQLYAGRSLAQAAPAHGRADPVHDDRDHQQRGGSAVAGGATYQAFPAAL